MFGAVEIDVGYIDFELCGRLFSEVQLATE